MKINKLLILILIFLFFNAVILQGFDELFEKKLKHIKQFKPDKHWTYLMFDDSFALNFPVPESFIKRATCLKIKENKIFLVENNRNKLLIFDHNGNFIKAIGRLGRGPGDLAYPIWMEIYRNNVYILNDNGIDIYDKDLKFINRIRPFISVREFSINNNFIYCSTRGPYKKNYPLFLKLNMHGRVEEAIYSEDLKENLFRISKRGSILTFDNQVVLVSRHWNRIYFYQIKSKLLKRIEVKYELLDKIEEWNQRNKNRKHQNITWFSNMIASAKNYHGKIYLLLKIPRLEIICVDSSGNIQEHYYNDVDFRFMRWYDFDMELKGDKLFFYVLGESESIGDENERDLTGLTVHRVMVPVEKNKKSAPKKNDR